MGIRKFKPVTPGTRFAAISDFAEITTDKPEKSLLRPKKSTGGRNHNGHLTTRHVGGGHKQRYRLIDFKRDKDGIPGSVVSIEYDPNRSARIALLHYADGEKRYIIAPDALVVGSTVISGPEAAPVVGNSKAIKDIPLGTIIHNIELHPGKGGSICRAAGTNAQILGKEGKFVIVKLPSGEQRMVLGTCRATIGVVSNGTHMNRMFGKAGRRRWLGRRPRVRAVAMNPVDHPMGGGEGRASGGHPRNRKGLPAKGYKTRTPKKVTSKHIVGKKKK